MARYIDAELALKIIDSYAKTVTADGKVVVDAIRDIVEVITPTADVVPKSEVEELQAEAENLRNANADLALALLYECEPTKEHLSELEKAVREKVAREIFKEIEEVFRQHTEGGYYLNGAWFPERLDLYTGDAVAELKKKYTEEKREKV